MMMRNDKRSGPILAEALEERLVFSTLSITPVGIQDGTSNTVVIGTTAPKPGLQNAQRRTDGVIAWVPGNA
jgi:hypothetical protein